MSCYLCTICPYLWCIKVIDIRLFVSNTYFKIKYHYLNTENANQWLEQKKKCFLGKILSHWVVKLGIILTNWIKFCVQDIKMSIWLHYYFFKVLNSLEWSKGESGFQAPSEFGKICFWPDLWAFGLPRRNRRKEPDLFRHGSLGDNLTLLFCVQAKQS